MSRTPNASSATAAAWFALGVLGLLFLVVGLSDVLLAWLPPRIGDADWELATVATTFNNFPVPAMGLGLAVASGIAQEKRGLLRVVAIVAATLAALSLLSAVLFALALPLALGAAPEGPTHRAVFSAALKTGLQLLAYLAFFLWILRLSWRHSR